MKRPIEYSSEIEANFALAESIWMSDMKLECTNVLIKAPSEYMDYIINDCNDPDYFSKNRHDANGVAVIRLYGYFINGVNGIDDFVSKYPVAKV